MAEIPSDIASSAAQAGFQAREVHREREAGRTGQAQIADRQVKAVSDAGEVVDTDDADTRVFADSEGSGSQGRAFEEAGGESSREDQETEGIIRDADGQLHLDLEA